MALALTVSGARARGGLAAAGILAVALICFAGALQLRPVPTAELNHLVTEIADPASVQHCTTASGVRYCLYPGFGRDLSSVEAPVNGVLAHLPARPGQPLTMRQAIVASLDETFTHGHPNGQVSQWNAQLQGAPGNAATVSAVYLSVGSWPAAGGQLADARFDVALAAADWAVHFPLPIGNGQPCVPLDQAREAIAIWLAILATHPPAGELQDGLHGPGGGMTGTEVSNTMVQTWNYPGPNANHLTGIMPQLTAAGYLLANAMTSLPEQKVSQVLDSAWATWLNRHTTDAQLATALGVPMPSVAGLSGASARGDDRAGEPGQRAAEPGMHHLSPRSRLSWLRGLPVLAWHLTATMPWITLLTGCLAGTVFLAVLTHVAGTTHGPFDQGTVRLAFLPAVAALAFLLRTRSGP